MQSSLIVPPGKIRKVPPPLKQLIISVNKQAMPASSIIWRTNMVEIGIVATSMVCLVGLFF
ncbi:hypothetical protein BTJ39_13870 [Izhakiella australiensis]|uniref:Uncharacterized protein n=1 Tax=Izhakiella australiensis TaxID=1926881 RepID=A0A1S8YJV6_9GAMM|nr:hypothetical protein BTJ39_13870 [Izhakiella australiensis]